MIPRLQITIAHVKACHTSENLLNEIRQIIYSLYQAEETIKKCIAVWWIQCRYHTKWILNLWIQKVVKHLIVINKINLKRSNKYVALS